MRPWVDEIIAFFTAMCMLAIFVGPVLLAIFFIGKFISEKNCENYMEVTGRQTTYRVCGGCFIQTENGWLAQDEYGQVIIAREGLKK